MTTANFCTSDVHALVGAWRLKAFQIESSNGDISYPFGEAPQGMLLYSRCGLVSAQLMGEDRPLFESDDQRLGTVSEIEACFKNCISYFGTFELHAEDGYVIHHVENSLFPNWEGTPQKRFFELNDNTLRIATPPVNWAKEKKVGVLIWERA
jgi:hypothetical protein